MQDVQSSFVGYPRMPAEGLEVVKFAKTSAQKWPVVLSWEMDEDPFKMRYYHEKTYTSVRHWVK